MTDKEILIAYFNRKLKGYRFEEHKQFLIQNKIVNIDYWVNTKWGQDKIKEIKGGNYED